MRINIALIAMTYLKHLTLRTSGIEQKFWYEQGIAVGSVYICQTLNGMGMTDKRD